MIVSFDAEVRKKENRVSSKTNMAYVVLHMEDMEGNAFNIMCKHPELLVDYKKGDLVHCQATLTISKYTKFELIGVEPLEEFE